MYDIEKIKECLKQAQDAVKDEVEPYRMEAFKITFSKLLDVSQKSNEKHFDQLEPNTESNLSLDQKICHFAKKCNLTTSELKDVFSLNDELAYLISPLEGKEAEKHTLATQCILTAYELLFGIEWVESSTLMKCIDLSGIDGLDHVARNIRKRRIFRIRGKGKGHTLEYKISGIGKLQAYEIIHDLAKGEVV